jgi:hypothetical protein
MVVRFSLFLALFVASVGCNENSLRTLDEEQLPPLDIADDDDDTTPDPETSDDDDSIADPPDWRSECPPEAFEGVGFYGPAGETEIYVLDSDPTEATATLVVPVSGLYAVYDTAVSESGSSQINETGFLRIRNSANPDGVPRNPNCGPDYVVQDSDNSGAPPAPLSYLGMFELVEGDNTVTLYHFCPLFNQGECEDFHIGDPEGASGCSGSGPNSIHLAGDGICLVPL